MVVRLIERFLSAVAAWVMGPALGGLGVYALSSNAEFEDNALWLSAVGHAWVRLRRPSRRKGGPGP